MLFRCGMDCANYSRTLAGWALTTSATNRDLDYTGLSYGTNVSTIRSILTGTRGWNISNDAVSSGSCGPTVFYSKSTGNLDDLATWGSNANGTGTSPTDFTDPDQYFAIRNRSTASLSGNWSTTGDNSLVVLGDGTNAITLTTGTNTITGTFRVLNNAALQIGSNPSGMNFICDNGATVNYNGSSAQTIAPEIVYRNLTIAGSNAKTLGGNTAVEGDLTLSSNKLVLSQYSLTLFGSVTGAGGSNYVQTGSTGTLNKKLNTGSSFLFPVGNSAYNPVSITNNTSSSDEFSVRILDEVMYGGTTGMVATEPRVKRTWLIDKTTPNANSGSGVDFTFNWNSGEMVSITTPALYHFNGISWQKQTGTTSSNSTSLSYTGYTGTFSPFAIGDDIILLPVSWLYMRCNSAKPVTNTIQWATASQTNSRSFVVERSSNGKTFVALDSLAAAGNSHNANHYSYVDEHADLPEAYYRIKQVDENGSEHLSEICLVQTKSSKDSPMVSIYPNPAASVVFLSAGEKSLPYNWALYNTTGQLLTSGNSDGGQASINLGNIGKGIYNLHIQGEGFLQNVKLLVNP